MRPTRVHLDDHPYHVINRGNARRLLFSSSGDYAAFLGLLREALARYPARLLAYCVMPSHFHLVLCPRPGQGLSRFMHWLTTTHVKRWHGFRQSTGDGHVYQGRFRSFPAQDDDHLFTVIRYVERNPLRAGLVKRAEEWRWSSLWQRIHGEADRPTLEDCSGEPLPDWIEWVNQPQTDAELEAIRTSVRHGTPFGSRDWTHCIAKTLGLESTLRRRGRPRQSGNEE